MDMYQMYEYAKKYQTDEIFLIYPMDEEWENANRLFFQSDDGVCVNIHFVDCGKIEKSLQVLKEILLTPVQKVY